MEKRKNVGVIGSILVFFVLLFVYSKFGPAVPISVSTQIKGDPFMVVGEGKAVVVPDIAKINLGFEENGVSLKTTQDAINLKSQNLTKQLKGLGIDGKDIKTVSYNVYPNYDWESPTRTITGYRVSTSYEVTLDDFEKVNELLSLSSSLGVNLVGSVSFEMNDKTKQEGLQGAREEAIEKAKEKAKGLASASGISLGKIINVTETQDTNFPRPLTLTEKSIGTEQDANIQPDITPGETELSVFVTLSYEIR